jgi:hypothetical protein
MAKLYAWAVLKKGEILEIYKTKIGAERGLTRFAGPNGSKRDFAVLRLRCLFDELENTNAE